MLVGLHEAIHAVGPKPSCMNTVVRPGAGLLRPVANADDSQIHQSQESAPPVWYSITRVSKKLRSFFRSIISLIQGNGFSSFG